MCVRVQSTYVRIIHRYLNETKESGLYSWTNHQYKLENYSRVFLYVV